jgi:hypothetical protein
VIFPETWKTAILILSIFGYFMAVLQVVWRGECVWFLLVWCWCVMVVVGGWVW